MRRRWWVMLVTDDGRELLMGKHWSARRAFERANRRPRYVVRERPPGA